MVPYMYMYRVVLLFKIFILTLGDTLTKHHAHSLSTYVPYIHTHLHTQPEATRMQRPSAHTHGTNLTEQPERHCTKHISHFTVKVLLEQTTAAERVPCPRVKSYSCERNMYSRLRCGARGGVVGFDDDVGAYSAPLGGVRLAAAAPDHDAASAAPHRTAPSASRTTHGIRSHGLHAPQARAREAGRRKGGS